MSEKRQHPLYPDRWADGKLRAGHPGPAFKHGARSVLLEAGRLPAQADARAALQARETGIVTDLGGVDAVSAIAAGQVQRHVKLELVEGTLWDNLLAHGMLTGKGKSRAAALLWLQVVDRIQKSAAVLGLERRATNVQSFPELLDDLEAGQEAGGP